MTEPVAVKNVVGVDVVAKVRLSIRDDSVAETVGAPVDDAARRCIMERTSGMSERIVSHV